MRSIALHPASGVPRVPWSRRFGHVPIGAALVLAVFVAGPASVATQLASPRVWVAPLGWVALAGFGGLALLACALVAMAAFEQVRAAVRSGNWVAAVADPGVWLNTRSYLNWRLRSDEPTAAFVPFDAIRSVHEVRELLEVPMRARVVRRYRAFVVLTLHADVDPGALAARVARELREVASRAGFLDRLRFSPHVPVHAPTADEIWVEWRGRRLLRLLGERVRREETVTRRLRGDRVLASGEEHDVRGFVVELVHRGERSLATDMLMFHHRIAHAEADALVESSLGPG